MSNPKRKSWFPHWLYYTSVSASEELFANKLNLIHTRRTFASQSSNSLLSNIIPFKRLNSVGDTETGLDTNCHLPPLSNSSNRLSVLFQKVMPAINDSVGQELSSLPKSPQVKSEFVSNSLAFSPRFAHSMFRSLNGRFCDFISEKNLLQLKNTNINSLNPLLTHCKVNNPEMDTNKLHENLSDTVDLNSSKCNQFQPKTVIPSLQQQSSSTIHTPSLDEIDQKSCFSKHNHALTSKQTKIAKVDLSDFTSGCSSQIESAAAADCVSNFKECFDIDSISNVSDSSSSLSEVSDIESYQGFESDFEDNLSSSEYDDTTDIEYKHCCSIPNNTSSDPDKFIFTHNNDHTKIDSVCDTFFDETDSDNISCQWDRVVSARTPWTCVPLKKKSRSLLVTQNDDVAVPHDFCKYRNTSDSCEDICSFESDHFDDQETSNTVTRPSCENNSISWILGCSVNKPENGYESDSEESDAFWSSDLEYQEEGPRLVSPCDSNGTSQKNVDHNQSSSDSCHLWDYFSNMQSPLINSFCSSIEEPVCDSKIKRPSISNLNSKTVEACQPRSPSKVRFNDKVTVHPLVAWSFAYKKARKGEWETFARDRERFTVRIASVEREIAWCFNTSHRHKVFASLYS